MTEAMVLAKLLIATEATETQFWVVLFKKLDKTQYSEIIENAFFCGFIAIFFYNSKNDGSYDNLLNF
jgi:hypothetical protein